MPASLTIPSLICQAAQLAAHLQDLLDRNLIGSLEVPVNQVLQLSCSSCSYTRDTGTENAQCSVVAKPDSAGNYGERCSPEPRLGIAVPLAVPVLVAVAVMPAGAPARGAAAAAAEPMLYLWRYSLTLQAPVGKYFESGSTSVVQALLEYFPSGACKVREYCHKYRRWKVL
ncbi:hypothetical protein ABBQ38_003642 [Trebouxia sp. C0009 RCD-2024]